MFLSSFYWKQCVMSSCNTDQQEKSCSKTIDSKKPTSIKHCQDLPEEKNGQVKGTRITDELLEYFRQQNEEMKRCRRKYDMAVYKVYGTVPWTDNPTKTWTILITANDFSALSVELHLMSTMWNNWQSEQICSHWSCWRTGEKMCVILTLLTKAEMAERLNHVF